MKFSVALCFALSVSAQTRSRPALAEPSLAPDRPEIVFVSGGDIWTVPLAGGEARLLVSHSATESRPLVSPDGRRLAFTSTRTGNGDVYVLDLRSGDLKRLTFTEAPERADAWSPDGKYVYFSSAAGDIAGMNDIYRVPAEGGTPMPYSADRYASEYFAAPCPAGDTVAMTAKGIVSAQWWRKGHSHIDESEIWLRADTNPPRYERVSQGGGSKDAWPMWSPDGKRLFFMSDRGGAENIWEKAPGGGSARQLTQFQDGRVLWPSIAADGKTIVFERDLAIWRLDIPSRKAAPVEITLRGVPAGPAARRLTITSDLRDLVLSPDGKKIAFTAHGDVFAASAKDGGTAQRLTDTPALERSVAWAPDSRRIVYTSDRNGVSQLFLYDLAIEAEKQLTREQVSDASPYWSPDGKYIAFFRDGRQLLVLDPDAGQERRLATGVFVKPPAAPERPLVWSPDSKWIAYAAPGTRLFRNVFAVPVAGGAPVALSFLPNTATNSMSWSPDGTFILYGTGQRTEPGRIARIDLLPRTPKFREDQFRDLFRQEPTKPADPAQPADRSEPPPAPAATGAEKPNAAAGKPHKPVRIVPDGIRRRLSLLPVGIDVSYHAMSPDGKWLLLSADVAGQPNLYVYSLDELAREPAVAKQLTSTSGPKRNAQFTPDSKEVYFLDGGRIQIVNVETRQVKPLAVTAEADVDFATEKLAAFTQAWSYLRDHFYDDNFHGVDWNAARQRYEPFAEGARTGDELRRVISLMIGELNASHLGITAGPEAGQPPVRSGDLGLRFDRQEYESSGRLRITEVTGLGPADVAGVKPGEYLLAVNGRNIDGRTNLDELLEHSAGRRVLVTFAGSADGSRKRSVAISPVSVAQAKNLLYRDWVDGRRDYVHSISHGRLGYVHMPDMSAASLDQLYIDLDAENMGREGVVVDIRNNSGGFVNVYALDVLTRRGFLQMTPRGEGTAPARSVLGQRALERPTILVVNQHSLSDAEDFTEGYRALHVGKVVGEETAGWIIYTGAAQLIDGSVLRLPRVRITGADGKDMELNPRPVDIRVERPFGESYTGGDTQLDTAVRELLREIDRQKTSRPVPPTGQ